MNLALISTEIAVALLGVVILLLDLWTPAARKRLLGWGVVGGLLILIGANLRLGLPAKVIADQGYTLDAFTAFFRLFFLVAGVLVTLLVIHYAPRLRRGIGELYALICFALTGMLLAAGSTSFVMLFVAIELITITFYVLTSLEAHRARSLEAGVKYLILGAASSAVMVFGIALIYGATGHLQFGEIAAMLAAYQLEHTLLFKLGIMLVLGGLAFKIAAVPFQLWAPDVYQGAPTPVTAFLAAGPKAAGFALLLRVLLEACSVNGKLYGGLELQPLLAVMAAATILYGSLGALRQRQLKRLLGYASIASAGYALLGVAVLNVAGAQAVLFYLGGYLFAVLAAFTVITVITEADADEDIGVLANLHQRSPWLAAVLTLAIVSLAGVPPLVGFFGKFLLLKAALAGAETHPLLPWAIGIAIVGVVVSFYYYFAMIREIYWGNGRYWETEPSTEPIICPAPAKAALLLCALGLLLLGLYPEPLLNFAISAAEIFAH